MYCRNCGGKIENPNAYVCLHCGGLVNPVPPQRPKFYSAGFVLGILSVCIIPWGIFLGIIGLPLACLAKRKSAIILNSIGIVLWIALMFFIIPNMPSPNVILHTDTQVIYEMPDGTIVEVNTTRTPPEHDIVPNFED